MRGGEKWSRRRRRAHGSLLEVKRGDVEGARPTAPPVYRHHLAIVGGESVPDSAGEKKHEEMTRRASCPSNSVSVLFLCHDII